MKNRLHCVPQTLFLLGLLFFLSSSNLFAQSPEDDFVFTYAGADTLYVGEDCTVSLFNENNAPNWTVNGPNGEPLTTPTVVLAASAPTGAMISEFAFEPDSTGFGRMDPIMTGNSVRVVYRVTHDNNNMASGPVTAFFNFTLEVVDTLAPQLTVSANRAETCTDTIVPMSLTPVDNCDGVMADVPSSDIVNTPFDKCTEGEIIRSWTATDSDGNVRTVRQTITVLPDVEAPMFNYEVRDLEEACDDPTSVGFMSWLLGERTNIMVNATENCTDSELTDNAPTGTGSSAFNCNEPLIVTFTLTDSCGNARNAMASYTVIDTIAPILSAVVPDTINLSCTDIVPPAPVVTASDNCTPAPMVQLVETRNPPTDDSSITCGDYTYTITRVWTATDDCGNSATTQQIVNIVDDEAPDFTRPADVSFYECDVDINDLSLTGSGSNAADNCDMSPVLTYQDDTTSMDCAYSYVVARSWMARDVCNNVTTKIQTITVQDTIAPTFIVPQDATVDCRAADSLNLVGEPTMVMDNCDPMPMITFVDVVSGQGCINGDTIRRIWRVEDECGNLSRQTQLLFISDEEAPELLVMAQDTTIDCADSLSIDDAFNAWIENHGGADANDNCSPDSTLTWLAFNTGTNNPATLPRADCADSLGIYRTQTVDFIVADECDNRDTTTARFDVIDTAAPEFTDCPSDTTIFVTDPTACGANWRIIPIPIIDECGVRTMPVNSGFKSRDIRSPDPGNPAVPVDTIEFSFFALPPPFFPNGDAELTIRLSNVDAEQATEYYDIFGEGGEFLGRTENTPTQCDTSLTVIDNITPLQLSQWAADGRVVILMIPNTPAEMSGEFAINDICSGGTVDIKLEYVLSSPNGVGYQLSVNDEPPYNFPYPSFNPQLPVGDNTIKLFAEDCSGNRDSCVYVVTVVDTIPPMLICNGNQTVAIDESACTAAFTVPLPADIFDNCEAGERYNQTQPTGSGSSAFITFSRTPNIPEFVADERTYTFNGTAANAVGAVELIATIRANVNGPNRHFTLVGEDGTELGQTATNGRCDTVIVSTVTVPATLFNQYAADGQVSITARPQRTFQSGRRYITPCIVPNVDMDGETDSLSTFTLRLTYQGVNPEFVIEGATSVPLMQMMPPQVTPTIDLNVGDNIITYFVDDIYENRGSCSDTITVVDNIPPVALCQGTTVFINPSGTVNDTVMVSEIDAGSSDNCGIANISVSPNVFGCDFIDRDTVMVTLRVEDLSGNVSTCQAPIRIVAQKPEPTFFVGDCANSDTLFLFANPPAAPGGIIYTYEWTGPNNYRADVENPVIANVSDNAAGTYTVTITGITGCMATGIVEVNTDDIPVSPAVVAPDVICSNEDLVLQTSTIPGANYEWYSGIPGDSTLLATTATPMFTVQNPPLGTLSYFVIVVQQGCMVQPSEVKEITVVEQLEAVVNESNITICEGESITLQTFVTGDGVEYEWTGPNGYFSALQFPPVIENATSANAGTYRLIVSQGGCDSEPAFTAVNILERPNRPQISNNGPVCRGEELTFTTNITNASVYTWIAPDLVTERTTNVPTLTITTTASDNGSWTLYVTRNTCDSENAVPTPVRVNPLPNLVVSSTPSPACQGQDVQLNASPTLDGATYQWSGPNNFTSASQNPILRDTRVSDTGTYTVTITTPDGCVGMQTLELEVQTGIEISGITNNGSNCLNGPTTIELSAMLFPADDGSYAYEWRGPTGNIVSTDSIAVIPNATQNANGTYTLNVSSGAGCNSATATTVVNVTDPPAPPNSPQFNVSTMSPFCEGDLITLETTGYSGEVEYIWTTPLGTITTETPSLTLESAAPDNSGAYSVSVMQNGCVSNRSGETNVTVTATPIAIVDSNSPVCEGSSINLEMEMVEGAMVAYSWTGPDGFTSTVRNPVISPVSEENEGTYIGTVSVNGCMSMGSSIEVEVSPVPNLPVATSNGPICLDEEDATLILAVVPSSATPGAMYSWFDRDGNQLATSSQSLTLIITNFGGYGNGTFPFSVEAEIDGCSSGNSVPVMVQMNTIPDNTAFAGDDTNVCENESIVLNATSPTVGEGMWTLVEGASGGVNIANPSQANTTVSGLVGGNTYTFQWALSNGACVDYSTDRVTLTVDVVEQADAGTDIDTCEVNAVSLAANPSTSGEGEWSQPNVQAQLGVNIVDPNEPNTEVVGLVPGNQYVFTWTIFDNKCAETMDDVLVLVASGVAFAGTDFSACGDGCVELNATASPNNDGRWSSLNADITFTNRSDPNTVACGLKPGDNRLIWTINGGACGDNSIDEVIITYTNGPVAVADEIIVEVGGVIDFDVDFNDDVIGNFTVAILDGPNNGVINEIEPGFYTYTADASFIGIDELTYEICNIGCECSTTTVTFFVGNVTGCVAPSIFTPNNDGINDAFVIPCLNDATKFPEAELSIFNQWGDEVFRRAPYKNTWQGRYDGQDLPEGTYFYIIEFVDGSEPMSGFVMLQR